MFCTCVQCASVFSWALRSIHACVNACLQYVEIGAAELVGQHLHSHGLRVTQENEFHVRTIREDERSGQELRMQTRTSCFSMRHGELWLIHSLRAKKLREASGENFCSYWIRSVQATSAEISSLLCHFLVHWLSPDSYYFRVLTSDVQPDGVRLPLAHLVGGPTPVLPFLVGAHTCQRQRVLGQDHVVLVLQLRSV